jgi:hypothetical protein
VDAHAGPFHRPAQAVTIEEDVRLRVVVAMLGAGDWGAAPKLMPGRADTSLRERWGNTLDPSLQLVPWTKQEVRWGPGCGAQQRR